MGETLRLLIIGHREGSHQGIIQALADEMARQKNSGTELRLLMSSAASREEALTEIDNHPPDIVVIDSTLSDTSSIEIFHAIKAAFPSILVIMIPANTSHLEKVCQHWLRQHEAKTVETEPHRTRFELLSTLVHELKAPLAAVEGHLVNIRDGLVNDPETFSRAIERSIFRLQGMRQMILDLLDMARLEAGMRVREFSEVDLKEIARQSIEAASLLANQRGIIVTLQVEGSPSIEAVRAEMEIIFNNLVSNAIKYNRPEGRVFVSLADQNGEIRISVRDTGIGISVLDQAKLFRDFVRLKNPKTRGIEGSGLGLATVRKITTLYGGAITVTSTPDEGSTFTVCLKKQAVATKFV